MAQYEATIANTRLDRQGERLAKESLLLIVESINKHYIPVGIEHDPRQAPIGRVLSAFVRDCEDGEHEVIATFEIFDESPAEDCSKANREVVPIDFDSPGIVISRDWTHRHADDLSIIHEIAIALGTEASYQAKKSADPISVISLTGAFLLGGIASGFLNKVGSDAWDSIILNLKKITRKSKHRQGEQLFVFRSILEFEHQIIEVETIITDPSDEDIECFFGKGLTQLDIVCPYYVVNSPNLRRLVFSCESQKIALLYGVRSDCVAVRSNLQPSEILCMCHRPLTIP